MALIIETGQIVAGANSYATVQELADFAAERGRTPPASIEDCEVALIRACDYLQSLEPRFKGQRTNARQALAWPRYRVQTSWSYGFYLEANVIPTQIKQAQMALALESMTNELQPTRLPGQGGAVIREEVGSLRVHYAEPFGKITQAVFAAAEGFLTELVKGGPTSVHLVRA